MLTPGTRLAAYEILTLIGSGGMGEVYRAKDTKLGRDVALKILPASFTTDPERVARFRREAQVLASLNHPHIAQIYGLEESNGTQFLVLELVDGESLDKRIARGAIPVDEALGIAKQIAEALEAAHEKGIIHRDLKPANIALTKNGHVKVLDFGLAKAIETTSGAPVDAMNSPTITSPAMMTGISVILGTAAYMAPEQAKGRGADKRSDIWAFGCVLYEMLTRKRAFDGEDVSETLASVLKAEPSWKALPPNLSSPIRVLVEGCLKKNREQRFGDVCIAIFLLNAPSPLTVEANTSQPNTRALWWARAWTVGTLVASGIMLVALWPSPRVPPPVTRFTLVLPEGQQLTALNRRAVAISPDGTEMAYVANRRLFVRSMSDLESRVLPGVDNIANPTFSPDGQSLAFWSAQDSTLKRVAIRGGPPLTICAVPGNPAGMAWGNEGLLFSGPTQGVLRVSPNGGVPQLLIAPDHAATPARSAVANPQWLTDDTVLFTAITFSTPDGPAKWQIAVQSVKTGQRKVLIDGGADARYMPTGHLVYAFGGTLFGVGFDVKRLVVTGTPVPIVEGVLRVSGGLPGQDAGTVESTQFAVSATGTLMYIPGPVGTSPQTLALYDRNPRVELLKLPPGSYALPRVSPDGTRVAFEMRDGKETNLYIYELSGVSAMRRLTFGGNNRFPVWSADGKRVAFQSDREGDRAIFWQSADGGTAERLTRPEHYVTHLPQSWSPSSDVLLFDATTSTESSLWSLKISDKRAVPFGDIKGKDIPSDAVLSPDGRWVAYQVGTYQMHYVFVEPVPPNGTKFQVGVGGRPLWSRDGKELLYVPASGQFLSVGVRTQPTFAFTNPVSVPRLFAVSDPLAPRPFDLTTDGRFVIAVATTGQTSSGFVGTPQIDVAVNWVEELKARVAVK